MKFLNWCVQTSKALGNSATNEQVERFVDWMIENVPQAFTGGLQKMKRR